METREFLFSKISDTEILNRVKNVFSLRRQTFWFEVLNSPPDYFLSIRNFGKKSDSDMKKIISDHGIDVARWQKISDSKQWDSFLVEYILIIEIPSIAQTAEWDNFCKLYSSLEPRYSVNSLCCYNFIMISGECPNENNIISKILSWGDYYLRQVPEAKDRAAFEQAVEQVRKLVTEYYEIECKKFIDVILAI